MDELQKMIETEFAKYEVLSADKKNKLAYSLQKTTIQKDGETSTFRYTISITQKVKKEK